MINLWDPSHLSIALVVPTAFLLGMVHGITPDEHTWPITFSYSVGSYSARGGRRAGFLFSAAFTLQRAIAAELAFLALSRFELSSRWGYDVYLVVGAVMVASGLYVLRRGRALRVGRDPGAGNERPRALPWAMPLVHGFIAGWGVGAFAVIVYSVLAPAMGSAWVGWVPGALFGLGTMATQVLFGLAVGAWMARRHLPPEALAAVARTTSGRILVGGGGGFVVAGLAGLAIPGTLDRLAITTPLHVHNLHHLGVGFVLAVVVLFAVALWAFRKSLHEAKAAALAAEA